MNNIHKNKKNCIVYIILLIISISTFVFSRHSINAENTNEQKIISKEVKKENTNNKSDFDKTKNGQPVKNRAAFGYLEPRMEKNSFVLNYRFGQNAKATIIVKVLRNTKPKFNLVGSRNITPNNLVVHANDTSSKYLYTEYGNIFSHDLDVYEFSGTFDNMNSLESLYVFFEVYAPSVNFDDMYDMKTPEYLGKEKNEGYLARPYPFQIVKITGSENQGLQNPYDAKIKLDYYPKSRGVIVNPSVENVDYTIRDSEYTLSYRHIEDSPKPFSNKKITKGYFDQNGINLDTKKHWENNRVDLVNLDNYNNKIDGQGPLVPNSEYQLEYNMNYYPLGQKFKMTAKSKVINFATKPIPPKITKIISDLTQSYNPNIEADIEWESGETKGVCLTENINCSYLMNYFIKDNSKASFKVDSESWIPLKDAAAMSFNHKTKKVTIDWNRDFKKTFGQAKRNAKYSFSADVTTRYGENKFMSNFTTSIDHRLRRIDTSNDNTLTIDGIIDGRGKVPTFTEVWLGKDENNLIKQDSSVFKLTNRNSNYEIRIPNPLKKKEHILKVVIAGENNEKIEKIYKIALDYKAIAEYVTTKNEVISQEEYNIKGGETKAIPTNDITYKNKKYVYMGWLNHDENPIDSFVNKTPPTLSKNNEVKKVVYRLTSKTKLDLLEVLPNLSFNSFKVKPFLPSTIYETDLNKDKYAQTNYIDDGFRIKISNGEVIQNGWKLSVKMSPLKEKISRKELKNTKLKFEGSLGKIKDPELNEFIEDTNISGSVPKIESVFELEANNIEKQLMIADKNTNIGTWLYKINFNKVLLSTGNTQKLTSNEEYTSSITFVLNDIP